MRDTQWLQKAAAALTAMLKLLITKMVSHSLAFLVLTQFGVDMS